MKNSCRVACVAVALALITGLFLPVDAVAAGCNSKCKLLSTCFECDFALFDYNVLCLARCYTCDELTCSTSMDEASPAELRPVEQNRLCSASPSTRIASHGPAAVALRDVEVLPVRR